MTDVTVRFELFATDVVALAAFLRDALNFETVRESPGYVEMSAGSVTIGVGPASGLPPAHPLRASARERLGLGVEIVLETDSIDAWHDRLLGMGYAVAVPLGRRSWGLRDFRLVAPDGYYVRVTSRNIEP
jgi:uncharacterized glyoxalase superfamily protein PhnB